MCFSNHTCSYAGLWSRIIWLDILSDEEGDEYRERLAELDEEEFPEEEEEEDEEEEGDARQRMRSALVEKFEEQTEALSTLKVALNSSPK